MMEDVKLNKDYSYIFNNETKKYDSYYKGSPLLLNPKRLFKYYSLNINNIDALYEKYFWLSNPVEFNDPFDCNLNLVEEDNVNPLVYERKRNDLSNVGIISYSEKINEPLLWAHYTNNYRGFALEFNPQKLTVAFEKDSKRIYSFNPCIYLNKYLKVRNTQKFAFEYLLTVKSARWKYEKEWRFISSIENPEERKVTYLDHAVKALYIGYRVADEQESAYMLIAKMFEDLYKDKPIYVVHPHPYKLRLNFEKIYPFK